MPRRTSHRTRPSLTFLRTAAITAAAAIAVGGVLIISGGGEDIPAAGENRTSPNWPGGDSSLSVLPPTSRSITTGPSAPAPTTTTTTPAPGPTDDTPPPNNAQIGRAHV